MTETGSISAAGRAMGMSYRRAWLLVDALNRTFSLPVVETRGGGAGGGGASLTLFGTGVVESYRAMERDALARHLAEHEKALAPAPARTSGGHDRAARAGSLPGRQDEAATVVSEPPARRGKRQQF